MGASGFCRAVFIICLALPASPMARADDYPTRTIKMIVPTGAGGITDVLARLVGKQISERLGQPVIIDNRAAGATGCDDR